MKTGYMIAAVSVALIAACAAPLTESAETTPGGGAEMIMGRKDRPRTIQEFMKLGERPRVIAHRGFSGTCPENTMVAFRRAIEVGADAMELDVLLSRDGRVVVIHDDTLDRTTDGVGAVSDHDWADLAKLDAGTWFAPEFKGEPIPLLDDVLDLVRDRILLNIEIKSEAVTETTEGGIADKIVRLVNERGMRDQIIVSSFHPLALKQIRELDERMMTAMLYNSDLQSGQTPSAIIDEIRCQGYNLSKKEVTPEIVAECHAKGAPVSVYTVNDAPTMKTLIGTGVNALFTDRPDIMLGILAAED